jgi:hypothetical protein
MIGFRKILPLAILGACWLYAGAARASGDFTCAAEWKLNQRQYADCDNLPFLSPGNDTRVNLQLLLMDAGQAKLTTPPATTPPTPPIAPSAAPFTWEGFLDLTGPNAVRAEIAANGDYEEGEGSRCRSNKDGAAAFKAALDASPSRWRHLATTPRLRRPMRRRRTSARHSGGSSASTWSGRPTSTTATSTAPARRSPRSRPAASRG